MCSADLLISAGCKQTPEAAPQTNFLRLLGVPGTAENLAVFRIVVAVLLLGSSDLYAALQVAALPAALRSAPAGAGPWLLALPIGAALMRGVVGVVVGAALCGLIGLCTRAAFAVAAAGSFLALGVAQLGGAVWHCHHLLWFSVLLAASPCGDAISVDAWRAARSGRQGIRRPALHYALPLGAAWALLGVIFFFPGWWKLRASGLGWIWSDNLRNQMYWKWLQLGGTLPWLRIDQAPLLCRGLAALTVAVELSFPFLVFYRRSRYFAIFAVLLFHLGARLFMGIDYSNLWPCYLVFFDWTPGITRLRKWAGIRPHDAVPITTAWSLVPAAIVGGVLLFGSALYGVRGQMNAWPFACYPTFQWLAPATMPALLVQGVSANGTTRELPRPWQLAPSAGPRGWALGWSVAGVTGRPAPPARLHAYWDYLRLQPEVAPLISGLCAVKFYRAILSVQPAAWTSPPLSQTLLYSLALPCSSSGS